MQHIIQIAFDFDDEKVAKSIEQNVEATVVQNIEGKIKDKYFAKKWGDNDPISGLVKDTVREVVGSHTEEIVKSASKLLCDKLFRTKAVKEAALEAVLDNKESEE